MRSVAVILFFVSSLIVSGSEFGFLYEIKTKDDYCLFFERIDNYTDGEMYALTRNGVLFETANGEEYGRGIQFLIVAFEDREKVLWIHNEDFLQDGIYGDLYVKDKSLFFSFYNKDGVTLLSRWRLDLFFECNSDRFEWSLNKLSKD